MATVLIFKGNGNSKSKLKSILVSIVLIGIVIFVINNVEIFYEIIGRRMVNMFQFILGEGTSEGSINTRTDMIKWGWEWFKERPLFGYGIDNYKYLYGYINSEGDVYSHNNIIELMVGTGIVGTALFYIANIIVIKDLLKASKITSKLLCYSFIAIIAGYIFMSVGLIYYYGKHISIILAVGSIIYRLSKTELKKS
jgi:O-antigen ligase